MGFIGAVRAPKDLMGFIGAVRGPKDLMGFIGAVRAPKDLLLILLWVESTHLYIPRIQDISHSLSYHRMCSNRIKKTRLHE